MKKLAILFVFLMCVYGGAVWASPINYEGTLIPNT
jgi:hypothetical protein